MKSNRPMFSKQLVTRHGETKKVYTLRLFGMAIMKFKFTYEGDGEQ